MINEKVVLSGGGSPQARQCYEDCPVCNSREDEDWWDEEHCVECSSKIPECDADNTGLCVDCYEIIFGGKK